jgi:uncharacterized membrane protein YcaP (DUF421 family)
MDLVIRATVIFVALFVIMRFAGNRQFSELTTFDAVLIIVIAEVTGNSLSGEDYSLTASIIVITTLVALNVGMSILKRKSHRFDKVAEGVPILLVENGRLIKENMDKERIDVGDILAAARQLQGLERIDQIHYAVLEREGKISIIPS